MRRSHQQGLSAHGSLDKHFKVPIEINPVMSDDEYVANQEAVDATAD
jgi:hypothetical protein